MNWLEEIWKQLSSVICVEYMIIFMLLSYLIKRYFEFIIFRITGTKWKTVYTVLIIATSVAIPFIIWSDVGWIKIAVSYTVGTSLHELIFRWIEKKITNEN